ncbi:DNA-directed RNA polymerase IV subunit 1 isoform X1 [Babesia caballi]|uniref:DNA-directed RNA polymerase IV subunit 1 isoform X1 n=1 Tax=Babesia caballi TaxID=5871 RepID=A0AAV4LS00_BABCB|nr:DNA-directed RNA polymerase IV subunit 1 isoform X1 [Babesia caballi]
MVAGQAFTLCLLLAISASERARWRNREVRSGPCGPFAAATAAGGHRNQCFIASRMPRVTQSEVEMSRRTAHSAAQEPKPHPEASSDAGATPEEDPTAGDPTLDGWKADMADIPGPWRIYYPCALKDTVGLSPNANIRPSVLFFDISGAVAGPEHPKSPTGAFVLDAGDSVDVDDGESFVHSRRLAVVMLSAKTYSNIRLLLLGRAFYSKEYVLNEIKGLVKMRAVMFVGQAFVESYLDKQANEVDPLTWEYQPLNAPGSPFRWMHGTDKWKLLGPFTAYKLLGPDVRLPHKPMIFDKYSDPEIYNYVDPLSLNKAQYTKVENIETETRRVIDAVFQVSDNPKKAFRVAGRAPLDQFYDEMVQLAKAGPEFYRGNME